MNKPRRKTLDDLLERLSGIRMELEAITEEEESSFENLPESLQNGERGIQMETNIECLRESLNTLEEVHAELGNNIAGGE